METFFSLFYLAALILGLCLGSFYNVCIHRYLTGESIVWPGSHCPGCRTPLSWRENIPLISYIILRGKCRSCSSPISFRYPLVEAISGILALLLAIRFGPGPDFFIFLFFFGLLTIASFIDLESFILPDIITIPGALLAFGASFILPIPWQDALAGGLLGAGLFLLIQWSYRVIKKQEGLGTGDIKLMLMLGALTGWQGLPIVVFSSAVLGLGASLFFMGRAKDSKALQTPIPFGPFLAMGGIIYILWGETIWMWYLG
ncbi:prepilin peptidase [Desulfonatronovibrio hydrogenovorans]|uniref:prepilin peptidase n=1 Tax=Desulfonatronovibrio hydrogenovorans TaxID=53245 RepID=UPI00048B26C2|nr:A24 family peptidase [Desulfonatronovibrio hydrogenovorans]